MIYIWKCNTNLNQIRLIPSAVAALEIALARIGAHIVASAVAMVISTGALITY